MILITGGAGFIGLNCALHFAEAGHSVVAVDREAGRAAFEAVRKDNMLFESADVLNEASFESVVNRYPITGIVHFAFPPNNRIAAEDYVLMSATMMRNVVKAARAAGVKRVTTASSIAVYFGLKEGPYREDTELPMASPSGISAIKKTDEIICDFAARSTGLELVSLRLATIYGPRYRSMFHLPSRLCHAALGRELPPAPSHGAPDIIARAQDYCYVADCVRAIRLIQCADKLSYSIYNVGSGAGSRNDDIAAAVKWATGDRREGPSANAPAQFYLDITRVKNDVGFEPLYDLRRGIATYLDWLRTHDY